MHEIQLSCRRKQHFPAGSIYFYVVLQLRLKFLLEFCNLTAQIVHSVVNCKFLFASTKFLSAVLSSSCPPLLSAVFGRLTNLIQMSQGLGLALFFLFFLLFFSPQDSMRVKEMNDSLLQLPLNKDSSDVLSPLQGLASTEMPVCAARSFTHSLCFRGGGS